MMRGLVTVGAFLAVVLLLAAPITTYLPAGTAPGVAKAQAPESGVPAQAGVRFDSTVTLGNLLTALAFLVGIIGAFFAFTARMARLELKVDTLWRAWLKDHRREETDG